VRGARYVYTSKLEIPEKEEEEEEEGGGEEREKEKWCKEQKERMVKHPSKRTTRVA